MSNNSTFKKTPLALAIAGLTLSLGVQADSAFNFGRWAGGGGNPGGACHPDDTSNGCNQDETLVQRTLTADVTGGVIYAAIGGEGDIQLPLGDEGDLQLLEDYFNTVHTGVGTFALDIPEGGEGGEGTASFSLNPADFDGTGTGNYSGPAEFDFPFFFSGNEDGGIGGIALNESGTFFAGIWGLDGFIPPGGEGFGFFVAGEPTSLSDMASLAADDIVGVYYGFSSPYTGFEVEIGVNFSTAEWEGSWEGGDGPIEYFDASGTVAGSNFNADFISVGREMEADPGSFVEGTFFGSQAGSLGGHFEVSTYGGEAVVSDIFGAEGSLEPD